MLDIKNTITKIANAKARKIIRDKEWHYKIIKELFF